jgi:hypothetical protein
MQLRNWEFFDNGNPVVGASVYVRDGVLTHPNTNTVLAATSTDTNGMWQFGSLTDTPKDVEVVWGASNQYHKWYKGMTRHNVAFVTFGDSMTFPNGLTFSNIALSSLAPGSAGLLRSNGTVITAGNQISDGDVATAAAIALSKLAAGSSGFVKSNGTAISAGNTIGTGDLPTGIGLGNLAPGSSGLLKSNGTVISAGNQLASGDFPSGVVGTAALAAGAATQSAISGGFSGTTTSTTYVDISGSTVTITTTGGNVLLLTSASFKNTAAGNTLWLAVNVDGGSALGEVLAFSYTANQEVPLATVHLVTGLAAGSHTFVARWHVGAGTGTMFGGRLIALELKK